MSGVSDAPPSYEDVLSSTIHEASSSQAQAPSLPPRPAVSTSTAVPAPPVATTSHPSAYGPSSSYPMTSNVEVGTGVARIPMMQTPQSPSTQSGALGPFPRSVPTNGHPFMHRGKVLLYPRTVSSCNRCHRTGYCDNNVLKPCKRCWRNYGYEYKGKIKDAYEQRGAHHYLDDKVLQQPLFFKSSISAGPTPSQPYSQPYTQTYRPPYQQSYSHPFAVHPASASTSHGGTSQQSEVFPEDKHNSAPPRYDLASQTSSEKPLAQQNYPSYAQPTVPPMQPAQPYHPMMPMPPQPPVSRTVGPTINWYGYMPPPGAVTVAPGDPRIGGVLCYRCGGSGSIEDLMSLFFGDDECPVCGGAGRISG